MRSSPLPDKRPDVKIAASSNGAWSVIPSVRRSSFFVSVCINSGLCHSAQRLSTAGFDSTFDRFIKVFDRGDRNSCARCDLVFRPLPSSNLAKKREERTRRHAAAAVTPAVSLSSAHPTSRDDKTREVCCCSSLRE